MIGRFAIFLAVLFLSSCARNDPAPGTSHATVQMRDGTTLSGAVLASSPAEIKLAGDDKITRTIPMAQVRSVSYDDAPAAAAAPAATGAPPVAGAPSTQAPEPDPVHDQHAH